MRILALDTAMGAVSACVWSSNVGQIVASESQAMVRGHGEALMPLVQRVLGQVEGGFQAIERVAVTTGPGSFTGLRIGISAARGFALALNVPVVGVSTLAALAAPWLIGDNGSIIVSVIDARHGRIYMAAYTTQGRALLSPRVLAIKDAAKLLGSGPVRLTGSGAPLLAMEAWNMGVDAQVIGELVAPDIAFVAKLGFLADPATAAARPIYLKAPDVTTPKKTASVTENGNAPKDEGPL